MLSFKTATKLLTILHYTYNTEKDLHTDKIHGIDLVSLQDYHADTL